MDKKELAELCFLAVYELNKSDNAIIDRNDFFVSSKHFDNAMDFFLQWKKP